MSKIYIPGDPEKALRVIEEYMKDPNLTTEELYILKDSLEEVKRRLG